MENYRLYRSGEKGETFRRNVKVLAEKPIAVIKKELAEMDPETRQNVLNQLPKEKIGEILSGWYEK